MSNRLVSKEHKPTLRFLRHVNVILLDSSIKRDAMVRHASAVCCEHKRADVSLFSALAHQCDSQFRYILCTTCVWTMLVAYPHTRCRPSYYMVPTCLLSLCVLARSRSGSTPPTPRANQVHIRTKPDTQKSVYAPACQPVTHHKHYHLPARSSTISPAHSQCGCNTRTRSTTQDAREVATRSHHYALVHSAANTPSTAGCCPRVSDSRSHHGSTYGCLSGMLCVITAPPAWPVA